MSLEIKPLEMKYADMLAEMALENYLLEKKQVNALIISGFLPSLIKQGLLV